MTSRPSGELTDTFDPTVLRAMTKWPDVPECYDWLRLDRRGRWLLQGTPVTHAKAVAFINRHYAVDEWGRWYFQNGPQRVFVELDYTPWIFRIDGARAISTHTGRLIDTFERVHVDADGNLLLETNLGIGLLCDRDLPAFVEAAKSCTDSDGDVAERLMNTAAGKPFKLEWSGRAIDAIPIEAADVPRRFGFIARPQPEPQDTRDTPPRR